MPAKAHQKNPLLAQKLEAIAHSTMQPEHEAIRGAVEGFKARRRAVQKDNRRISPELLKIWKADVLPHLTSELKEMLRNEVKSEMLLGGPAFRRQLIEAVAKIVKKEPRLLETRSWGITKKLTPEALATALVNGIVKQRVDYQHDLKHNLIPEREALRQSAQARNQARAALQERARKIFAALTGKPTSQKKDLQQVIQIILQEYSARLKAGKYWSHIVEVDITEQQFREQLPADFFPVFRRIFSKYPERFKERTYYQFLDELLASALEFYGFPLKK